MFDPSSFICSNQHVNSQQRMLGWSRRSKTHVGKCFESYFLFLRWSWTFERDKISRGAEKPTTSSRRQIKWTHESTDVCGEEEVQPPGAEPHWNPLLLLSAGIGRTGCFIASSIGCRQLIDTGQTDILETVCQLRLDRWELLLRSPVWAGSCCLTSSLLCRGGMIQTTEQYQFLYSTLAQYSQQLQHSQVLLMDLFSVYQLISQLYCILATWICLDAFILKILIWNVSVAACSSNLKPNLNLGKNPNCLFSPLGAEPDPTCHRTREPAEPRGPAQFTAGEPAVIEQKEPQNQQHLHRTQVEEQNQNPVFCSDSAETKTGVKTENWRSDHRNVTKKEPFLGTWLCFLDPEGNKSSCLSRTKPGHNRTCSGPNMKINLILNKELLKQNKGFFQEIVKPFCFCTHGVLIWNY